MPALLRRDRRGCSRGLDAERHGGQPAEPQDQPIDRDARVVFGVGRGDLRVDARAEVARRVRQAIGRGMRSQQQACDVWILDPRFPLPSVIINRGEATQKKAADLLPLVEAIPERFRRGINATWHKASIFPREPTTTG